MTKSEVPRDRRAFAYVRIGEPDKRGRKMCRSYLVPLNRDGEKIEVSHPDDDPYEGHFERRFEAVLNSSDHVRIKRLAGQSANSPDMWFVVVDDSVRTGRDTRSIVGFATQHFPDGTIIDEMEFVMLPVSNEQQIAAIQWLSTDGTVEQIYVDAAHRRSDVGMRMGQTAGAYHQVCGWPGVVHASGRRTALGESFAVGGIAALRVGRHEELSPPMDD